MEARETRGRAVSGGGDRSQVEGNFLKWRERSLRWRGAVRWRGAISGGGERSQVEKSERWWRGAVSGGGERSLVEGSGLRWRGAVSGAKQSQVQGSGLRWRELAGGEELSEEGSGGTIAGGGERSLVEGSCLR